MREFDLLGDPIPASRGKPGRTGHVATAENCRKVRALLVARLKLEAIAEQLGVSVPTLRKHYFKNGRVKWAEARAIAVAEFRARMLLRLDREADKGNVGAIKAALQIAEKAELEDMPAVAKKPGKAAEPLGKKERVAREAMSPAGDWAEILPGIEQRH